ncbi:hypothetical protein BJG93_00775 [Paraburkholderia sprentiae WSM5005]|uniref:Uncharacterized protein n=1 Tax=Paraburkholderia sprentiae WSM5005 TaxID=754502 RepID=A0A1I9YCR3_9BURK|nr:hypothetical protein [Paraburkholderia sprentiae]APA84096.2 hypothetical protein BJG93_00775 [Paraburkholderia sprentiae WSM5005]
MADKNVANPAVFSDAAALNDKGMPVIELITQMFVDGQPFGEIATFAIPVLRHCKKVTADALIGLLDAVSARNPQETMMLGGEVQTVIKRDVKLGFSCLERVLNGASVQTGTAAVLAIAIAQVERGKCIPYFVALGEREGAHCSAAALYALASLGGKHLAESGCVDDLRKLFHIARSRECCSDVAFNFLCHLASFDPASLRELGDCVQAGSEPAFLAGIRWLRFAGPELLTSEVSEFLLQLTRLSVQNPEYLNEVESNLSMYLHKPENRSIAYEMLDILSGAISWDFGHARSGPSYAVVADKQVLSTVAAKWLLQDAFLKEALQSLLTLGVSHGQTIQADVAAFQNATPGARRRAVHRLLGLSNSGTLVARFLLELALDKGNQSWAQEAFLDVVGNYLSVEYPGEIRDFLKSAARSLPRGKFRTATEEVLKHVLDWAKVLQDLPVLPELAPTRDRRLALRLAIQRRDAEISRMVEEKSVMAQIVSRAYIKQGRRFAVRMPDGSTTVTEMKTVSVEFELPSSEVLNPLEALLSRTAYVAGGAK